MKYGVASVSYNVTVADITSIEMIEYPESQKFEIAALADGFVTDGYKVQINYANGEKRTLDNSNFKFNGEFTQAGKATVDVYYFGHKTSFEIDLIQLVDIKVTPNKTYRYGQTVNISDFDIEFIYSDESTKKSGDASIELTYNEDAIKKNKMKAPGTTSIVVTATNEDYGLSFEKTVDVVTEAPIGVEITKEPTKTEYQPNEKFDSKGLEVKVIYDEGDGKTKSIKVDAADYTCTVSTATPGKKSVSIKCDIPGLKEIFDEAKPKVAITVLGEVETSNTTTTTGGTTTTPGGDFDIVPIIIIVAAVVVVGGVTAVVIVVVKKKKK